jgi:hypothetical protein
MNDIEAQIKALSAQASQLSQKATEAFRERNFASGKQLMAQAVAASKDCQRLIQEYRQQAEVN